MRSLLDIVVPQTCVRVALLLLSKCPLFIAFLTISVNVENDPVDSVVVVLEFEGNDDDLEISVGTASAKGVQRRVGIDEELPLERLGAEKEKEKEKTSMISKRPSHILSFE